MQTVAVATPTSAGSCEELGRMGLVDTSRCCERCHYADGSARGGSLGPCRVALPDGREAFVCCAGKKQLLGRTSSR